MWSVISELIKFFSAWFATRNKVTHQLEKVIEVYDNMHRLINNTSVRRLLVLRAHNGGGKIKPGCEIYASVVYEDYRFPFVTVKADYQKIPVDQVYVRLLVDTYANGCVKLRTSRMKDGLLKRLYQKEGVGYAEVHYLTQDKNYFYYCSFATEREDREFSTPGEKAEIEIVVNNIKKLLQNKKK